MALSRIFQVSLIIGVSFCLFLIESLIKYYLILNKVPLEGLYFFAGWLQIAYFTNSNMAFGIPLPTNLIIFQVVIVLGLLVIFWRHYFLKQNFIALFAISLLMVGAFSNLLDRLLFGYVIDYINVFIWPVFNLADCLIVLGILIYLFSDIKLFKRTAKLNK